MYEVVKFLWERIESTLNQKQAICLSNTLYLHSHEQLLSERGLHHKALYLFKDIA